MFLDGITRFCFGASYTVALLLELAQLFWPRPVQRLIGTLFGVAGLLAHTLFLVWHRPTVAAPYGSLLVLAWVLAIFYLYGSLHYRRVAWGVFVLPVVAGMVLLSEAFPTPADWPAFGWDDVTGWRLWGAIHGTLLLLAFVGVSVGFLASLMYLIQSRRLRAKLPPGQGLKLLSLERLEQMNRRAINTAFPFLSLGLLVGALLMAQREGLGSDWLAPKVLGTLGLWVVFLVLLYLRYAVHVPGRRLALLTLAAFVLMLVTLAAAHPVMPEPPVPGRAGL